ncbi:tyrosine-type recombinase/integrase [Saccharopolyspora sp. NPDC002376]
MTRYRDRDGRTRPVERWGSTEAKARNALREALADRSSPEGAEEITLTTRFEVAANMWLDNRGEDELSESSRRLYKWIVKDYLVKDLGGLQLRECTAGRLNDLFLDLKKKKLAASTRRMVRSALNGTMRLAVLHEALDHNPVKDLPPISDGRNSRKGPDALNPTEVAELLAAADTSNSAKRGRLPELIRFMLWTGCRIGEALAVRWREVNFGNEPVLIDDALIQPAHVSISGTIIHRKGVGAVRVPCKTESSHRVLALPESLLMTLALMRGDSPDTEPLFPSPRTLGYRQPSRACNQLAELVADMGSTITSHKLRRTAATALRDANLSDDEIAAHLGHTDISTTRRHYIERRTSPAAAAALQAAYEQPPNV